MPQSEAGSWQFVPSVRPRSSQQVPIMQQQTTAQQRAQDLRPDQDPAVYKTQMCNFFKNGFCPRADRCTFAHDPAELQAFDPGRRHLQQAMQATYYTSKEQQQDCNPARFKTTMCFFHQQGICQYGNDCTYAHHPDELRLFDPSSAYIQQAQKIKEPAIVPEEQLQYPDPACHKTTMCRYHQQGCCRYGKDCSFAHDASELKAFDPARRWSHQAQAPSAQTLQQYLPQTLQIVAAEPTNKHSAVSEPECAEEWPLLPSSSASVSSSTAASEMSTPSPRTQTPKSEAPVRSAPDAASSHYNNRSSSDHTASQQASVAEKGTEERTNNGNASRKINGAQLLAAFTSSGSKDSEGIPFSFTCSITMELMNDPVMAADGHTYERQAIMAWLQKSNISPNTNEPFAHQHLVPNLNLKDVMATYLGATKKQVSEACQ